MTVVQGVAVDGTDTPLANATIAIVLAGEGGSPIVGYTLDEHEQVGSWRFRTAADGVWSADLIPNSDIVPAGSVWKITEIPPHGTTAVHIVSVPDSGGPYWVGDLLTDPPGSLPSIPLTVHENDPTGAHAASAVAFTPGMFAGVAVEAVDVQGAIEEAVSDLAGRDDLEAAARADADAAEAATRAAADVLVADALVAHETDTTAVHGISDTAALVYDDDPALTDAREPLAHAPTHADGGTDEVALDASQVTSGVFDAARLPALAISDYLGDVASEAAMLALVGERGDWATRSDLAATFILAGDDPTVLANWKQLPTPTDAVLSVNSRAGVVTGLAEASDLAAETAARTAADAAKADKPVGGVLAGNLPNATFAVDMATQAELDAEATARASADNLQAADAALRYGRAARQESMPVADRAAPPFSTTSNLSTVADKGTARLRHTAIATCHGIVLAFSNWYNNAGSETDGPSDIVIAAAVEPATTKLVPVTFRGALQVTVKPGCTVFSDPLGVSLYKGQQFFTRTYVESAGQFPRGGYTTVSANGEGHNYGVAGSNLTPAGSAAVPAAAARVFGPSALLGYAANPRASVVGIVGDSLASGMGDSGIWLDGGWIVRALNLNYAYQSVALPSHTVDGWYAQEGLNKARQQTLLGRVGVTHLICELGVNGLSAGFPTWSAHLLGTGTKGAWGSLAAFGVPMWQTTITPQTTSTDGWATVGNQTVASSTNETARVAANAWLRDGAPITASPAAGGAPAAVGTVGALRAGQVGHPLVGVLEVADLAESARDSGKWKAGYTGDGTHPNATGAAALAAALDPALLGLVGST